MATRLVLNKDGMRKVSEATQTLLISLGEAVATDARSNAPVDTGNLKSNINMSAAPDEVTITAEASYSAYVELGTSKSPAQPYLKPALYTKRSI